MTGSHDLLVDPIQHFGGEQAQVVLQCLQRVARVIRPIAMAKHLADGRMLVGQFLDPIVISIQPQTQGAEYQDAPLGHARSAGVRADRAGVIDPFGQNLRKDGEHPLAHRRLAINELQAAQEARDIVTRLAVEFDGGDVLFAELELGVDDLAHDGKRSTKFFAIQPATRWPGAGIGAAATENQCVIELIWPHRLGFPVIFDQGSRV